jgi:hypothetical protein
MINMKRFFAILSVALLTIPLYASPRANGFWGTATDVNTTITPTFNASGGCIFNTDTTNDLYVDITDGVAAATSGGSNWRIPKGQSMCFGNTDPNVLNLQSIGVICSAGLTATYIVNLYRAR